MDFEIIHQAPNGVEGGDALAGVWQLRNLNTIMRNANGLCSASGGEITIPPGAYRAEAMGVAYGVNRFNLRLVTTTGTVLGTGFGGFGYHLNAAQANAFLTAHFDVAEETTIRLEQRHQTERLNNGMGVAGQSVIGSDEKYAYLRLWRLGASGSVPPVTGSYEISARKTTLSVGPGSTEANPSVAIVTHQFQPSKTGLVIIDAWQSHPNEGFAQRLHNNIIAKAAPCINHARALGCNIIHAPSGQPIHSAIGVQAGESLLSNGPITTWPYGGDTDELQSIITTRGLDTLIYIGYAINICHAFKPAGTYPMFYRLQSIAHPMRFLVVRDATIAYESPDSLAGEHQLRDWSFNLEAGLSGHGTTTVGDFLNATSV